MFAWARSGRSESGTVDVSRTIGQKSRAFGRRRSWTPQPASSKLLIRSLLMRHGRLTG
jgi:hypothetical protein